MKLHLHNRTVDVRSGALVMGVLNVTPDSFSDGGRYSDRDRALPRALEMIDEGAAIIDIGPESTRPGAMPVPRDEQIRRAVPVIEALRGANEAITISIDTRLSVVADAALKAGADWVNDISALRDDADMADVVSRADASVVLMHMKGSPADMQRGGSPDYADVIGEIAAFLGERRDFAVARGVGAERILLDPGIGFGKRVAHNLRILNHLDQFTALGCPVLIGASRKSFIGEVLGVESPAMRLSGSLACAAVAVLNGAAVIRTHDVRETVEVVRMVEAIRMADAGRWNESAP